MEPTRYPLQWPVGWKRTPAHRRTAGQFSKKEPPRRLEGGGSVFGPLRDLTIAEAVDRLLRELERMAVPEARVIISTNVQPTLSGRPRSGERIPADPGAAVYWHDTAAEGGPQHRCMAIDRYTRVEQNIAALAATIEAMRAIERHGGAVVLNRAFAGFTALPAPIVAGMKRPWREVLDFEDFDPRSLITVVQIQAHYRVLAAQWHPDRAPPERREEFTRRMAELNAARDEALQEVSP